MISAVVTMSAVKTIAMPIPRRMRRSSNHLTAGLMVPTMTSAATSTRTTGNSLFSTHRPPMMSSRVTMVPGDGSMRITRGRSALGEDSAFS